MFYQKDVDARTVCHVDQIVGGQISFRFQKSK